MAPPETITDILCYTGTHCLCVQLPLLTPHTPLRYAVQAHPSGRTVGELRWHPQKRQYVFVPGEQTAWTSRDVSEIGLWLRRLTREQI